MNPTIRRTSLLLSTLVVAVALVAACSPPEAARDSDFPLPAEIQGMRRVRVVEGAEAQAMIGKLHGKDIAPLASYVGHYGEGPTHTMLYTSRFEDAAAARETLEDMSLEIGEGSSGFSHHMTMDVAGTLVHLVLGQGKIHFFFADDANLSWLAIEPSMAGGGLAKLLGAEPTAVRAIVRAGAIDGLSPPAQVRPDGPSSRMPASPEG
ncbi:MAG: hypothetical protein ACC682_14550 [Gemmatimonadota bacterium]